MIRPVLGVLFSLLLLCGCSAGAGSASPGTDTATDKATEDPVANKVEAARNVLKVNDMTCRDVSRMAVEGTQQPGMTLLEVVRSEKVEDARPLAIADLPTGTMEDTVLTCLGTGRWANERGKSNLRMFLKVDSQGRALVHYQAVQ